MTEILTTLDSEADKVVEEIADATLAKFAPGWSHFVGSTENEFSPTKPEVEAVLRTMIVHAVREAQQLERGESND